ncbi:YkvI family membrane protein [Bacillus sp. AK128]
MWRNGIKWMFLILGTMIGAGYASGRELWQFFGAESGLAILLFMVLFSICCYVIMKISYEEKTEHFLPILNKLIGSKLSSVYDIVIIFYLFTTTMVMLAGGGAAIEIFHIPYWIGIVIFSCLLVILFIWNIKGMTSLNSVIIPLLIVGLIGTIVTFMMKNQSSLGLEEWTKQSNWPSAFTFTALNVIALIAVVGAIGREIKHKNEAVIASVGSGLILGGIAFFYNQSLLQVSNEIVLYEIPLFAILKDYPYSMIILMTILLWTAIFTTAASGIFGLTSRFRQYIQMPTWIVALIILLVMIPLTKFGFSTLVAVLYPIYGLINLYLVAAILIYPIANRYKWE